VSLLSDLFFFLSLDLLHTPCPWSFGLASFGPQHCEIRGSGFPVLLIWLYSDWVLGALHISQPSPIDVRSRHNEYFHLFDDARRSSTGAVASYISARMRSGRISSCGEQACGACADKSGIRAPHSPGQKALLTFFSSFSDLSLIISPPTFEYLPIEVPKPPASHVCHYQGDNCVLWGPPPQTRASSLDNELRDELQPLSPSASVFKPGFDSSSTYLFVWAHLHS
jgi:hypothetical protein